MQIRNYEYFLAIVEAGSITKAAEQLYVSQPSLSQYLKRLEKSTGVELFDHGASPLRLTYTGERFYRYVLKLKEMEENMKKEFQDIQSQTSGRLRLGVALWRGACLLPEVFPLFHKRYPDIQIELFEGRSNQLESALMNDNLDMAIMNLPPILNYSKLTCDILFDERILVAAPTSHPYVQNLLLNTTITEDYPITSLEIVNNIPLIITKPGQNLTHEINHVLGKNHIEPDILLETGNLTTAINLVSTGIACTFLPEEGAKVCKHPGKVTYLATDIQDLHWPLAAVYRKDTYLTRLSRLFIETLREVLPHAEEQKV